MKKLQIMDTRITDLVDYLPVGEKKTFKQRYGIAMKAGAITLALLIAKLIIDSFGWSLITINPLLTAFLGGVFFTIGILFAGAVTDYKEAEKIPGELAVSLKTLDKDIRIIPFDKKHEHFVSEFRQEVKNLLYTITENLRSNSWKLKTVDIQLEKINSLLEQISKSGVQANFIIKLRSELTLIDRLSHRVDTIEETSFIPAAYTIAELAIGVILLLLLFVQVDLAYGGLVIVAAVSMVLLSLLFLIKDMDNPFEYGKDSFADVDLRILFHLEEYWKKS